MGRIFRAFWLHVLLAVIALALWDTPFVKPFRVLVVWTHEMGHALAALATGGEVAELRVRWNESGHVISRGGFFPVISSAGYVGSALLGALMIALGRRRGLQRALLGLIGAAQVSLAVLYTPFWGLDFWFGAGCGVLLVVVAVRFEKPAFVAATWFGVMLCLYSLEDFRTDLWLHTAQTDAGILARYLGLEILAYPIAFVWAGVSIWVMVWAMRSMVRGDGSRLDHRRTQTPTLPYSAEGHGTSHPTTP